MEYQKMINLLDNTPRQKIGLKKNDESHEVYNIGSQMKFQT